MPTILRFGSMRFQIYVDDHEPPHVHVTLPDGIVVVILVESSETVHVRETIGPVSPKDVRRVSAIVMEHFETLMEAWSRQHR